MQLLIMFMMVVCGCVQLLTEPNLRWIEVGVSMKDCFKPNQLFIPDKIMLKNQS